MFILALWKEMERNWLQILRIWFLLKVFSLHMFWACPRCVYDAWSDVWIDWRPSWCTDSKKFDISECIWIMFFCTAAGAFLADCDAGAGEVFVVFVACRFSSTAGANIQPNNAAIANLQFWIQNFHFLTQKLHFREHGSVCCRMLTNRCETNFPISDTASVIFSVNLDQILKFWVKKDFGKIECIHTSQQSCHIIPFVFASTNF